MNPTLAQNMQRDELSTEAAEAATPLSALRPGAQARVLRLAPECTGVERRRLLDLGFVPGTLVEVEMVSPSGDPTAYRLRGTQIALRREQSRLIFVTSAKQEVPR